MIDKQEKDMYISIPTELLKRKHFTFVLEDARELNRERIKQTGESHALLKLLFIDYVNDDPLKGSDSPEVK